MHLAQAALDIAVKRDHPDYKCLRVIHANLIMSRTAGLNHAACSLSEVWEDESLPLHEQLHSISTAFVSGIPLSDLAHHLQKVCLVQNNQQVCADSHTELTLRSRLVDALRCVVVRPSLEDIGRQAAIYKNHASDMTVCALSWLVFAGAIESSRRRNQRVL